MIAITLSCTSKINIGVLAVVMAWIIGVYFGGMALGDITAGFPTQLFLTLTGVTLLFTLAEVNGTLGKLAFRAVRSCRGNAGMIPIMFFVLALIFGSIGPGSIASVALLGPMAMAVAGQTGISPFLMTIMVANGAQASSLSPIAPTGIIVSGLMAKIGLPGTEWYCYMIRAGGAHGGGLRRLYSSWVAGGCLRRALPRPRPRCPRAPRSRGMTCRTRPAASSAGTGGRWP